MEVEVVSKVMINSLEALDNESSTNNNLKSRDDVTDISAGFKVLNCEKQSWVLDTTTGSTFSETVDVTDASFIHIQCNKYVATPTDKPDRRRFAVSYNAASIGNMSQFQTIDCDDIKALVVTNVDVPATEKAVITIIKGLHT